MQNIINYIDKLKILYEEVIVLNNNKAIVKVDGGYSIIENNNNKIIKSEKAFKSVKNIEGTEYIIIEQESNNKGIINRENQMVIPDMYKKLDIIDNKFVVCETEENNKYIGLFTIDGKNIIPMAYMYCSVNRTNNGYIAIQWGEASEDDTGSIAILYTETGEVIHTVYDYSFIRICKDYIVILYESTEHGDTCDNFTLIDTKTYKIKKYESVTVTKRFIDGTLILKGDKFNREFQVYRNEIKSF